jgi:HD-GYP domain-containing protein (c-di-GMP phosphodiesterase class II)
VVSSAPLHDVGKINVSDLILNKPGKLTDEEFEIMKTHTTAGGNIIASIIDKIPDSDYLLEAKNLAMYHHEKWNGKGYPAGLAGEDIPLSARVMAVADVFDALISDRCYKKGFPYDKAFSIILEERGKQFDPKIVDAFFAAEDQILEVADKFSENNKQETSV